MKRAALSSRPTELCSRDYSTPAIFGILLESSAGTGFSGCCRFGIKSFYAPPGKRFMLGYFMIVLSNSSSTTLYSAAAQPLSCPAYFPGARAGAQHRCGTVEKGPRIEFPYTMGWEQFQAATFPGMAAVESVELSLTGRFPSTERNS